MPEEAGLVLVTGGLFFDLPLPLAVVGHEGGTVLVVLNGLRLLFDPIRTDRDRQAGHGLAVLPHFIRHQSAPVTARGDGR